MPQDLTQGYEYRQLRDKSGREQENYGYQSKNLKIPHCHHFSFPNLILVAEDGEDLFKRTISD